MPSYVKQTWNNYDKSLTLEENINRNAVVTKENMDHIERGVHFVSASVERLETANKTISETVDTLKDTLENIPEDTLMLLQNIQAQNETILQEIESLKTRVNTLEENSVDDLTLTENRLQVSANGTPLGKGVDIVTPTVDDASYDGVSDGVVNVDNITYAN